MKKFLSAWWRKRTRRERIIAQVACFLVCAALVDHWILAPLRARTSAARAELAGARTELDQLQAAVDAQEKAGNSYTERRRTELLERRRKAEEAIRVAQVDLITPAQMKRELSAILEKYPRMTVVGMASKAPEAVGMPAPPVPGKAPAAEAAAAPGPHAAPSTVLYRHGIELTVAGRYADLVAYLQALEHAPYRVYWSELEMTVNDAGMPVTRIGLFTLSRDTTWLSL